MSESAIRNPQSAIEEPVSDYEKERRLYRAVKVVADLPEGRALIEFLCDYADYGATPFQVNPYKTAFMCGKQDPVNRLVYMVETPIETLLARVDEEEKKNPPGKELLGGMPAATWDLYEKKRKAE